MEPTLKKGKVIAVSEARNFDAGDVVVAFVDNKEVIKRISKYEKGKVYLLGDNPDASTDSRTYGWINDRHVLGKVIWPRNL